MVLYDLAKKETIEVLKDARDFGSWIVGWSPSGRYLAYMFDIGLRTALLTIYDFETRTYRLQAMTDDRIPRNPYLTWSPDERKLAFALIADIPPERGIRAVLVAVFDIETQSLIVGDDAYRNLSAYIGYLWSPNSDALTYVQPQEDLLMYFYITTGEQTSR